MYILLNWGTCNERLNIILSKYILYYFMKRKSNVLSDWNSIIWIECFACPYLLKQNKDK